MSDELKPQSIDTFEFAALLGKLVVAAEELDDDSAYREARAALIAHIDAWGARLAGIPVHQVKSALFNECWYDVDQQAYLRAQTQGMTVRIVNTAPKPEDACGS
jgi:hypothetical protein